MGIAYEHCRWCQGKPGGCLYCAEERTRADQLEVLQRALFARERAIVDGLYDGELVMFRVTEVIRGANSEEVNFHSDGVQTLAPDAPGSRRRPMPRSHPSTVRRHVCA